MLLTAHYDHLGEKPDGPGDRIFNGANDDGSGTVSVIEVARALARLPQSSAPQHHLYDLLRRRRRPPRLALLRASSHLADRETVARAESGASGPDRFQRRSPDFQRQLTGFDYSDLTGLLQRGRRTHWHQDLQAPRATAMRISARATIFRWRKPGFPPTPYAWPSTFPITTQWATNGRRSTYDNMAKVDRAVALSVLIVADSDQTPRWNAGNSKAAAYLKAWQEHHK